MVHKKDWNDSFQMKLTSEHWSKQEVRKYMSYIFLKSWGKKGEWEGDKGVHRDFQDVSSHGEKFMKRTK
jgi:hypothetical protein